MKYCPATLRRLQLLTPYRVVTLQACSFTGFIGMLYCKSCRVTVVSWLRAGKGRNNDK